MKYQEKGKEREKERDTKLQNAVITGLTEANRSEYKNCGSPSERNAKLLSKEENDEIF